MLIFSTTAYFLSIEAALYSVITYPAASKTLIDFLYIAITRRANKLNSEIGRNDTNPFVVMSSVKDTKSGMIKKRLPEH